MKRRLIQIAMVAIALALPFVVQAGLLRSLALGVLAIVLIPPARGTPPSGGLVGGERSQRRKESAE